MKNLIYFLIISASTITFSCQTNEKGDNSYETVREAFLNPPDEARPKVYWWCLMMNQKSVLNWNKMMVTN